MYNFFIGNIYVISLSNELPNTYKNVQIYIIQANY